MDSRLLIPNSDDEAALQRLKSAGVEIALIAALDPHFAIGKNGTLPWHLPEDLKHFKTLTRGHSLLMGRKTFESIGKPLPQRRNLVLTRNQKWHAEGVDVLHKMADLRFELCRVKQSETSSLRQTLWIIGGAEIYASFLPYAERLELTHVAQTVLNADAIFPRFDINSFETSILRESSEARYVSYRRKEYN